MNVIQCFLTAIGSTLEAPPIAATRCDLSERDIALVNLSALSLLAKQGEQSNPASPTGGLVAVSSAGVELAPATASGRFVEVVNNGTNDVLIRADGGAPAFAGGGVLTDTGILLEPGDYWMSPRAITTAVRGATRVGQTSGAFVTRY